ncbi:MAG: right-handed parallel beta-helix repeat-containing protein [Phycisphaerae bacterium]
MAHLVAATLLRLAILCTPTLLFGSAGLADIIYVDVSATGAGTGGNWTDALNRIQPAVDIATPGDEIWVATGVYDSLVDEQPVVRLKGGVALYGGFAGFETAREQRDWAANQTILRHSNTVGRTVEATNAAPMATLDGFTIGPGMSFPPFPNGAGVYAPSADLTIENCRITQNQCEDVSGRGGGLYCTNGTLIVRNSEFSANRTSCAAPAPFAGPGEDGGAVYLENMSSATFERCTFSSNRTGDARSDLTIGGRGGHGGALCAYSSNVTIRDSQFSGNVTGYAAGISPTALGGYGGAVYFQGGSLRIHASSFTNNRTAGGGGAVAVAGGVAILDRCEFTSNMCLTGSANLDYEDSSGDGGGLAVIGGTARVINSRFVQNRAGDPRSAEARAGVGGGLCVQHATATVVNSLFVGNHAGQAYPLAGPPPHSGGVGGGIAISSAAVAVINCTLAANAAHERHFEPGGGGIWVYGTTGAAVVNSILWHNTSAYESQTGFAQLRIEAATPTLAQDSIENWTGGGTDVWSNDPFFADFDGPDDVAGNADDDLRLGRPDTHCREFGSNGWLAPDYADLDDDGDTSEPTPLDLDERARVQPDAGTVDRGAYEYPAAWDRGDVNCDGLVNNFDIDPFVFALFTDPLIFREFYPACDRVYADVNRDGAVNNLDIDAFVARLIGE